VFVVEKQGVWDCVVAEKVVEMAFCGLETGVFMVGFTDLYVGFWGLEFGLRVSELGSEGFCICFRCFRCCVRLLQDWIVV